ncbi:DUF4998 domain-containing protein [Proteiniphilum sp.]|uniref:DUF4998 domain-containing protein n=1 Tax=Proteiniphilum sp. TaxID=1926877 RepID=UPI002B20483D|nr:DUF4998 domain-containing protein [Proteiniphilum sp.]MEA4917606.1 DUF4998 domain-containing protein [Proteiniphilum sp.]
MKHLSLTFLTLAVLILASCGDQYSNIEEYAGEVIYPARFDTIVGHIGYERVEIDLMKAGRIPSSQLKLGKAVRTVVEYDGEKHPIDSVCSWVNITGLTETKLYRFKVYTEDEFGNASVPQEIALIPFTKLDRDLLGIASPKLTVSPSAMVVEWPNGLNSVVMEYHGLTYKYTDKDGAVQSGQVTTPRFYCGNLATGQELTVDVDYKVVPIQSDGTKILDTVIVSKPLVLNIPTRDTPFSPSETSVLQANGITTFTAAAVENVTKLTYPLHTSTFSDLFYFPSLTELDLTGAGLQNVLPTLDYDRNGVKTRCGGGAWQPFMLRVEKPVDIKISSIASLKDILESGQLKKVRYIPKSMALDDVLAPYVASGVVELVKDDDPLYPNEVFIEPQFFVKGQVVDNNWEMYNAYSGSFLPRSGFTDITKFDPKNEKVNGQSVDLHLDQLIQSDGSNIYRSVIRMRSGSFAMALPKEYRYDNQRYKRLRFKMFCGSSPEIMAGSNNVFLQPWIRPMNYMWNFGNNSIYGQQNWDVSQSQSNWIQTAQIQNEWREYVIDMTPNDGGDTSNRRNRVIVFNIGHEPASFTYDATKQVVIYVADIRFTKN